MSAVHRRDVETDDRGRANELMRAAFPGIRLGPVSENRPFRFRHAVAHDDRLGAYSLSVQGVARGAGTMPEGIAIGGVRAGRFEVSYGRDEVDTSRPYLRPPGESTVLFQDARIELVTLDLGAFSDAAGRYLDRDRLPSLLPRTGRTAPRTPAAARSWRIAADRVLATAADADAFASPLVRDRLFDTVVRVLLSSFDLVPATTVLDVSSAGGSAGLRRAIAYVDEHIDGNVTVPDIAEAAHLSVRSVQYVFQRHLGVTPLTYLRERRLDAVRLELLASDPSVVSVGDVARAWGFAHLSRFARAYRERFGEYPSTTIRT